MALPGLICWQAANSGNITPEQAAKVDPLIIVAIGIILLLGALAGFTYGGLIIKGIVPFAEALVPTGPIFQGTALIVASFLLLGIGTVATIGGTVEKIHKISAKS